MTNPSPTDTATAADHIAGVIASVQVAQAALPIPEAFGPAALAAFVRELAQGIHEEPDILKRHGITVDQFNYLKSLPLFERMLAATKASWESADNTTERLKLEAAATLEDALPAISARMKDKDEGLNHVVEAAKLCARLAGIGENTGPANIGEKFSITINLGDDHKLQFEKDVTPHSPGEISADSQGARVAAEVREIAAGPGPSAPVQGDPPRTGSFPPL